MAVKVSGSDGVNQSQVAGATQLPVGTTAQRPANPAAGMIRFNTDNGQVEGYNDSTDEWLPVSEFFQKVVATGGTVTDIEQDGKQYRVHTFTSSGTFDVTRGGEVEYLVVAGGGGGGSGTAGGGGAGGYRSSVQGELSGENSTAEPPLLVSSQSYSVTVGGGGSGASIGGLPSNGQDSVFGPITSIGGGAGGEGDSNSSRAAGQTGGSGGGGWQYKGESRTFGSGTTGQGFDGGNFGGTEGGGGGGGAGQPGQDNGGGDGGDGLESSIDGTPTYRAGGGGGGAGSSGGTGGLGGGASSTGGSNNQASGAANTGGGGAGGWTYDSGTGGSGGSGIVIVRYRIG